MLKSRYLLLNSRYPNGKGSGKRSGQTNMYSIGLFNKKSIEILGWIQYDPVPFLLLNIHQIPCPIRDSIVSQLQKSVGFPISIQFVSQQ